MLRRFIVYILIALFLFFNIGSAYHVAVVKKNLNKDDSRIIRIAVYDAKEPLVQITKNLLHNFSFTYENITYVFKIDLVEFQDVVMGKLNSYDVLEVPGGVIYYPQTVKDNLFYLGTWKRNIRKFVADGGGYVGTCGGSTMASQDPIIFWPLVHSIGFVDLKVNVDALNEGQYISQYLFTKIGFGIPIKISIKNSTNPIFFGHYGENRSIRWWASPSLYDSKGFRSDPLFGKIEVLATYAEEPSEVAPIHRQLIFGGGKVKTHQKGEYAIIATTYGNGKVVLFGPHPEYSTWVNVSGNSEDNIKEGVSWRGKWYLWVGGEKTSFDYNWWMLRRAVAWVSNKVPDKAIKEIN
ncbi:MAG TPA: hypothetical protein ENG24_03790 [Thermoplasmatales archaeon]|nr:hypothetical protein [Thermoplasmatales archaeon]